MKKIVLLLTLAFTINVNAQDDKTVTLVVSGQGKTQDEAKQNALRSAIEQAFGTFISSKTEILNDNLVKDEIVSVANGNIQKFEIISEVTIPNGGYATTLKAIVSVSKLTSFCESKGVEVEFKGSLFSFNMNQQKINEENEVKVINDIIDITKNFLKKAYVASIKINEAVFNSDNNYKLPVEINILANENMNLGTKYFFESINKIALTKSEIESYKMIKKPFYDLTFLKAEKTISGLMQFYLWQSVSCAGKPNCKGWRDQKSTLEEFILNQKNGYSLGIKPEFTSKNYSFYNINLRSKVSLELLKNFINQINNYAFDFSIYTQDLEKIPFVSDFSIGSLPISSYSDQMDFFCTALLVNYESDNFSIKKNDYVVKNIGEDRNLMQAYKNHQKFRDFFFIQYFTKDALLLQIRGSCNLSINVIKKISSLKIQYN